jgi:hypothetical protein
LFQALSLDIFFFSIRRKKRKTQRKKNHRGKKKCKEGKALIFLLLLLHLGRSAPLAFSSPHSFNVELSTFVKPCVYISSKLCATQARELSPALEMEWVRNEVREVGGENFGTKKGAEKSLGRGRGCVFDSSPKWLEQPHPELVHWWLLVHSIHHFVGQNWPSQFGVLPPISAKLTM